MMAPVLGRRKTMQHKAMHNVFSKAPRKHASTEKHNLRVRSERRNLKQGDGYQGRYQHFAEINGGSHGSIRSVVRQMRCLGMRVSIIVSLRIHGGSPRRLHEFIPAVAKLPAPAIGGGL